MKEEVYYCDICKKVCTGSFGGIFLSPVSLFGVNHFDVCVSCGKDIRNYIRLKSKKSSKSKDTSDFDNDPSNHV